MARKILDLAKDTLNVLMQKVNDNFSEVYQQNSDQSAQLSTKANQSDVDVLSSRISGIIADGQQTEGNTELIDIRVAYDGTKYETAGDAVRGQISPVSETLNREFGYKSYGENLFTAESIVSGKLIINNNAIGSSINEAGNSKYSYIKVPVSQGEKYSIQTYCIPLSYANVGICIFSNDESITLENSNWISLGEDAFDSLNSELIVEVPSGAIYMFVNGFSETNDFSAFKVRAVEEVQGETKTRLQNLEHSQGENETRLQNLEQSQSETETRVQNLEESKLNKNQGISNQGKYLVVGSDGEVTLSDLPKDGDESEESNSILRKKGEYYLDSDTLQDLRVDNTSELSSEAGYEMLLPTNNMFSVSKPGLKSASNGAFSASTPIDMGFTLDFYFTGKKFEVVGIGGTTRLLLSVDCKIRSNLSYFLDNYSTTYTKFEFDSDVKKHITIFVFGGCKGIVINPNEVTKYYKDFPLVCFEGDSITEAASIITSGNSRAYGYPGRICQKFGWDLYDAAIGGSGYLSPGNQGQQNMVDRFETNVVPFQPDVFICCAGLNDSTEDAEVLKASIDLYWEKVKTMLKTKYIIGISPFNPKTTVPESLKITTELVRTACRNNKIPFIDIVNNVLYDAMGNIISTNDESIITSENFSSCIGDGTHLTKTGHIRMADKLSIMIWQIIKNDFGIL